MEISRDEKLYYDKYDIMKMYDCGINTAIGYLRAIKAVCGGGKLGKGKVLPCELEHWQNYLREVEERKEKNA